MGLRRDPLQSPASLAAFHTANPMARALPLNIFEKNFYPINEIVFGPIII
jgi:hypothetical protein